MLVFINPTHGLGLDSIGALGHLPIFHLLHLLLSAHCFSSFFLVYTFKKSIYCNLIAFLVRENVGVKSAILTEKPACSLLLRTYKFYLVPAIKVPLCRLRVGCCLLASSKISNAKIR